jgi:hypothetical protein
MQRLLPTVFAVATLVGSCQRAEPRERSLAGAAAVPGIEVLRGDEVALALVTYPKHEQFSETLQIEVRRDNSIRITHVRDTFLPGHQDPQSNVLSVAERRAPPAVVDQARKHISLLRPAQLRLEGTEALPKDCRWIADGAIDLEVAFMRQDKSVGFFILQDGCESPDVPRIWHVVRSTLRDLGISPGAYGFTLQQ